MLDPQQQFISKLEDKKYLAHKANRAENTDKIVKKIEEFQDKPSEVLKVQLKGVDFLSLQGEQGIQGEKGDKGDTGDQGIEGEQGLQGQQGSQGLMGEKGEKGDKGDTGEKGDLGERGDKGEDGKDGLNGKDGSPDDGEQIAEKLQSLPETKRLHINSLQGLLDFGNNFLNQAKAFVPRALASLFDVDIKNPTDGQALVYNSKTNKWNPGTVASSGGSGDVVGPASAVDSNFAAFDTTTGKLIKDSGKKASDFQVAGSYTPTTRSIATTSPLAGGGNLSADRTLTTSMATNKLIGRGTSGTGVMEEITLGTNLSFTGTTLNASGGGGGMAIGGAVTSGTSGSVLFIDGSGNLGQDNANFFIDDVTKKVGIGTNTPAGSLDVYSTPMVQIVTTGQTYADSTNYPGRDASKMFDGVIATDNDGWITNGVNTNSWGSIQFSSSKTVTLIKVLNGQPGSANRGIQHGKLEGSNDGITWTKLSAIGWEDGAVQYNTDEFTLANQVTSYQTVQFANTTAYTYYRIYGYDNYGDAYLGVLEMLMYSSLTSTSTLAVVEGMVGVGTESPTSALHVYSTTSSSTLPFASGSGAAVTLDNGTSGKGIISYSSAQMDFIPSTSVPDVGLRLVPFSLIGTSDAFFQIFAASGGYAILESGSGLGMVLESSGANPLIFRPNRTEKMRITSSGNVGIGTNNPGSKLSIVGLPTSSAGLSSGDIWIDTTGGLNVLKIV